MIKNEELLTSPDMEEESSRKVASLIEKFRDTPFLLVEIEEGYFLAHGNHRLTEVFNSKDELEIFFDTNFWVINGTFIVSIIDSFINLKNENKL